VQHSSRRMQHLPLWTSPCSRCKGTTSTAKTSTPPQSRACPSVLGSSSAASHQLHARPPTSLLDSPSLVEPLPVVSASFALLDAIDALTTSYYPYYLPPPHRPSTTHAHVHSPPIYHITTRLASPLFSRASHCDILLLRGPQHTLTTSQSPHSFTSLRD
jgi:hypothetical protein